jgi:glutaredoxin
MKFVRWLLGRLVLAINFLTWPKPIVRDQAAQQTINAVTAKMALYQFHACPFCVKVRRHMRRYALHIELRDAKNDEAFKEELIRQGGKHKVPCLRIESDSGDVRWLYESNDIISFMNAQFELPQEA